ncbi:MAG TPA: hypothetical protein VFK94_00065 [Patescibacteria group bacterium]|nr:hypothetical protein [Patescibacteria group bacterium]
MVRSANTSISLRIFGAENARGRITQYRQTTKDRITAVLNREAPIAAEQMRQAMKAAYQWGSGKAGESVEADVVEAVTGPAVRISIKNYREVKYLTTLLPDSDFRPGPYVITPVNKERLVFYFRRIGRWVALERVVHPGFPMGDVLRDSGEAALIRIGKEVEREVRSAVAEVHSGGSVFSVSRRR